MPRYRIPGFCKSTQRNRRTVYEADSLEAAMQMAYQDQIIIDVQSIEVIPDEPATQPQLMLAEDMKIQVPPSPTKNQMTALLSEAVERSRDKPTEKQICFAKKLKIKHPERYTREELSEEIDFAINDQEGRDVGPRCHLCGGAMKKKIVGRSFLVAAFFGLCFIVIGILLCMTGIGALLGIPLIIIGLLSGSKRKKVLACRQCGASIARI